MTTIKKQITENCCKDCAQSQIQSNIIEAIKSDNLEKLENIIKEFNDTNETKFDFNFPVVQFAKNNDPEKEPIKCVSSYLHEASTWNTPRTLEYLILMKTDINSITNFGMTPLHIACSYPELTHLVKILLEYNASKDILNQNGNTPLDVATECNCTETIKLLNNYPFKTPSETQTYSSSIKV